MLRYEGVPEGCREVYDRVVDRLIEAFSSGHTLFLCGNGGSAADCEHIVGELMKGFLLPREVASRLWPGELPDPLVAKLQGALSAVSLNGHPALAAALSNDTDAALIYAQQLVGLGKPGDVLLAISTSGNARNCIMAVHTAKALGMTTVALTGQGGGKLGKLTDHLIAVPEAETYKVQQLHLPLYHALCARLEDHFFGRQ
jgi:D-sedoheptulose 7-phosphate isomerase